MSDTEKIPVQQSVQANHESYFFKEVTTKNGKKKKNNFLK